MTDGITIEQAIFGYREGHHLVAASVGLSPTVRQFLATVTDGSGPESFEGFEAAFTGLPVPGTNYYALFCTWPAPEMPRPGCVWSHVLLIELADIARIPDLSSLRLLCRRPAKIRDLSAYEKPLSFLPAHGASRFVTTDEEQRAGMLLAELYGQPEKGIVVLDTKAEPWEAPIFGVWSQQWPSLRRNFIFSTGSLGDRRATALDFDLQIAPRQRERLWGRTETPTQVIDFPKFTSQRPLPPWLAPALRDLRAPTDHELREFLFRYGSDVEPSRSAFARLMECFSEFVTIQEEDYVPGLILLSKIFPRAAEAIFLKRDMLGLSQSPTSRQLDSAWGAIYFVLQAPEANAFQYVTVEFAPHVGELWQRKRADVIALLGELPESSRASDFIATLTQKFTPDEIPAIWLEQPTTISRVIAACPSLACAKAAWRMPESGQRQLWESLHLAVEDEEIWSRVCSAMLQAECTVYQHESVDLAGSSLFPAIVEWLTQADVKLPSAAWRQALQPRLARFLKEAKAPPALLALAVWAAPPADARAVPGHRPDVQSLARTDLAGIPTVLTVSTLFWLTAIGLQTGGKGGLTLLSHTFFKVYEAVARSDYPGGAWEILEPVLPANVFGMGWDRCRKLRNGLRAWIRTNPDFAQPLRSAAPTAEHGFLIRDLN